MFSKPVKMNNVTGSGGSPNFRIDVIFNSLRELQQEKERLQQHCNEEKTRCLNLEMKLEACQAKFHHSSERNSKMLETVNAAKQKVLQTQMQASRLKELNDLKSAKIEELRKKIDEEITKEQNEIQDFEKHLAELTNNFRNAKYYYTEENVNQEIEQWTKQTEAAKAEVVKEESALKELTAKFHQLEMENNHAKDEINGKLEFGLSFKELEMALKVFEEMNQDAKDKLQVSEQELEQELKRSSCENVLIAGDQDSNYSYFSGRLVLEQAKNDCQRIDAITSLQNEEKITSRSNERNTAVNEFVTTCSSAAPLMATGSAPLTQCNPNEGYKQLTKENHHQYFRHGSHSRASTSNEGRVRPLQLQSEGRKSSALQGRSFFISLPVTPNNSNN